MLAQDLHREILPLPSCLEQIRCSEEKGALSKVVLRRLRRRRERQQAVDSISSALNEFWGYAATIRLRCLSWLFLPSSRAGC
eukprot:5991682-Amphidinium_carterae.1